MITLFVSCNGSIKSKPNSVKVKTEEITEKLVELDNQVWAIFQDKKGDYWFGGNTSGLYHFDGKILKQYTTNDGLVYNQIRNLQEDKEGNLYIETSNGISKFDGIKFTTLEVKKSSNNEWKLEPDELWFGYDASDLYRYDGDSLIELKLPRKDLDKAFGISAEESNKHNLYTVYGVDKDRDGNIWFGTLEAGAFRYDGESFIWFGEKELSKFPDGRAPGVRSMIQDKDSYFWLSNFYSKYKINTELEKGYEKLKAVDLPKEMVKDKILYFNSGMVDNKGDLWMTTYRGGVWKYDGKTLSNFEINNGIEDVLLMCIYQDKEGTIWLGTHNDGVYKGKDGIFEKFEPNK